jgi:DNA-directed RNA polymerase specialized sigma24 family protein
MPPEGSITRWLGPLKDGDAEAVEQLWARYFGRLVGLARKNLGARPRRAADEEDVAVSAFDSFCRAAEGGRFPRLLDRDDLWHILVVVTARKAANLAKHERAAKRGGGRPAADTDLAEVIARDPDPAFAAEAADQCRHLLDVLGDVHLRRVAVWKMEGRTNEEVGALLDRSVGSVERKLRLIRALWEREVGRG